MPLSTFACKSAKPADRPYKVADSGGLYLLVKPNGSRLWRYDYRHAGKRKTAAFGAFPEVALTEARERRDDARKMLRNGTDPSLAKRNARLRAAGEKENTFEAVARAWHAHKKPAWSNSHANVIIRRLETYVFPEIGKMPIDQVDPSLLLGVLRRVEKNGAEIAKHMLQVSGRIFRFAIAEGRIASDPSRDLRGALKAAPPVQHRLAIKATDLPEFLVRLKSYDGAERTRLGLELIVLTMVRTSEARFARWSEFEGLDGPEPLWRISAERMKMRREHLVPLPQQAVAVLKRLKEMAHDSPLVLPAPTKTGVPSENVFIYAMYRMGYHSRATVHGFRGTASTLLNEKGFNRDWIEMQLAHVQSGVRAAYNSAEYLPGRRQMLQWWADHLDQCRLTGELVG